MAGATAERGNQRRPALVVEDEPNIIATIDRLLRRSWPLLAVNTAKQARATIEAAPALCCAIVDIGLPDGSGLDLLGPLREAYALLPVLVLTAHHDAALINRAQTYGVEYLVKPDFGDGLRAFAARVDENEAFCRTESVRREVNAAVRAFAELYCLSPREQDVLALAVAECSRSEIADRLGITVHTVKTQTHSILVKSGESSLVALARQLRKR